MQISWPPEEEEEGVGPTLPRAPPLRRPMVIILTPVIWKTAVAVWTALTLRLQVMSQITNIRIAKENVSDRISQQRRKLIWS